MAEDSTIHAGEEEVADERLKTPDREDLPPAETTPRDVNPQGLQFVADVQLRITVDLGRADMTVRDVLALEPGSVVELDKLAGEMIDVSVQDHSLARGEVMVIADVLGVRLTEIGVDRDKEEAEEGDDENI